ncbi:MAG: tetratricopeptide repeat protein [Gammaproteobacteria bacterium]|nr:tetratricopeptide repeat protein [Gammaproteobacteria bacterium]
MTSVTDGMGALKRGDLEVAEGIFGALLKKNTRDAASLRGLALICLARNDSKFALELLSIAVNYQPDYLEARCDIARIFTSQGQYLDALKILDIAISDEIDLSEAQLLRGNALRALGRLQDALACYERGDAPEYYEEFSINRANVLVDLKRFDEAERLIASIVASRPDNEHARFNQALLHLRLGQWPSGWPLQESRVKKIKDKGWRTGGLREELNEKSQRGCRPTVLVYSEQGLGDVIQYLRFLSPSWWTMAELTVQVPKALTEIVVENFPHLKVTTDPSILDQDFDLKVSLLSLPAALGFQSEQELAAQPYIRVPTSRVAAFRETVRGQSMERCIGVQWRGAGNPRLINRSMPIESLSALARHSDRIVSLRQEPTDAEAQWLDGMGIVRLDSLMMSFIDTAAVIENLDIVVTVDTSIAHLSGAMGKRTFVLIPYAAAWVWMEGRADSPWYPSVTLIRQRAPGDWASCLAALELML